MKVFWQNLGIAVGTFVVGVFASAGTALFAGAYAHAVWIFIQWGWGLI